LATAAAVLFAAAFAFEYGKNVGGSQAAAQEKLRLGVLTAMRDESNYASRLLELTVKSEPRLLAAEAAKLQIVPVPIGTQRRNLLLNYKPANPAALEQGFQEYPELYALQRDFLKQWGDVFMRMGDVLVQGGEVEAATTLFEKLVAVRPEDKSLLFALGELYRASGKPEGHRKAIAVYEDMIRRRLSVGDPRPWHYAGFSYYELGELDQAIEHYQKALEIVQDFPKKEPQQYPQPEALDGYGKIYFNLALAYRDHPRLSKAEKNRLFQEYWQKALDLTLRAAQREKGNPRIPFTLAILYAEVRDFEKVLPGKGGGPLERALRQNPFYVLRAEKERAFASVRDNPTNEPYYSRFWELLERYRPPQQGRFATEQEAQYDPRRFYE